MVGNPAELRLDEDPAVVKAVLWFIYTDRGAGNLVEIAVDVMMVAIKFGLPRLRSICISGIQSALNLENVVDFFLQPVVHNCDDLFRSCVPLLKAKANSLDEEVWQKLKEKPELLAKLCVKFAE